MKKLLVIRNDKIGDFMLAWPAFALLKQSMPEVEITALVPNYTKALAELCPFIDKVIVDPGNNASSSEKKAIIDTLKVIQFDASICFFSDMYNAKLVWRAGIRYRWAPATKLCQFLYQHRVKQKRSQSAKPEYQYNLDLARAFLTYYHFSPLDPAPPFLTFEPDALAQQKAKLAKDFSINAALPWLFVHTGSGGSANNLSLEQYAVLIKHITQHLSLEVVLTAGPGETEQTKTLQQQLKQNNIHAILYDKNDGLIDFTRSIACASAFIAGSTGPLHIAATLDVPTIGFFPAKRSATALRWKPINSDGRHLAFSPPADDDKEVAADMSRIDVTKISDEVNRFLRSLI